MQHSMLIEREPPIADERVFELHEMSRFDAADDHSLILANFLLLYPHIC